MERRVLFAVFLCFLVLYLWQALFVSRCPAGRHGMRRRGGASPRAPAPASATASASRRSACDAAGGRAAAAPVVGETTERDIRVETHDVIAVFTNRGARLKSWRLKHHLDSQKQPQELIESEADGHPLPFTLKTPDEQVNATLNSRAVRGQWRAADGTASAVVVDATELRFEYRDSAGVHAVKEFRWSPPSYVVTFRATRDGRRSNAAGRRRVGTSARGSHRGEQPGAGRAGPAVLENGSPLRLTAGDVTEQPTYEGNFRYTGVDDNYFMTVAIDPGPEQGYLSARDDSAAARLDVAAERVLLSYTIEPLENAGPLKFFVGPKELDVLTALDREFASAINFGWFAVIVVPLLQSLKWVHGYVGNWGWSIVILTVIINLVLAPLRHKQVVSMRKMQEIQPEVKAIQDRYSKVKATDPAKQKMNQEMMALYREKKVNPASGCIPVLLTFPIMIAMWAALQVSIELRGAPWFGWIRDLSAPDPWYVLPVLMVVTQFWQQQHDADDRRRSGAAEDDDVHAAHPGIHFLLAACRRASLLCGGHRHRHRAAVSDELSHRAAHRAGGAAAGRAAREAGRRAEEIG